MIYAQLILSGHSRYVNQGSTESDEIGGLITNDRWFLLGWFSSFRRSHEVNGISQPKNKKNGCFRLLLQNHVSQPINFSRF